MSQTLLEEVNVPKHYRTHESGIEAIIITRHLPNDLGNAWKYAMRYEDKNTPKKDLLKMCWYLDDYVDNFIDIHNCVTSPFTVPNEILDLMLTVIECEPRIEMINIFRQIYSICLNQGVVNPVELKKAMDDCKNYAETFEG